MGGGLMAGYRIRQQDFLSWTAAQKIECPFACLPINIWEPSPCVNWDVEIYLRMPCPSFASMFSSYTKTRSIYGVVPLFRERHKIWLKRHIMCLSGIDDSGLKGSILVNLLGHYKYGSFAAADIAVRGGSSHYLQPKVWKVSNWVVVFAY